MWDRYLGIMQDTNLIVDLCFFRLLINISIIDVSSSTLW